MGMSQLTMNLHFDRDTKNCLQMMTTNLGGDRNTVAYEWQHDCGADGRINCVTLRIARSDKLKEIWEALQADMQIARGWGKHEVKWEKNPDSDEMGIVIRKRFEVTQKDNRDAVDEKSVIHKLLEGALERQTIAHKINVILQKRLEMLAVETGENADDLRGGIIITREYGNITIAFDEKSDALRRLKYELMEYGRERLSGVNRILYDEHKLGLDEHGNIHHAYFGVADAASKLAEAVGMEKEYLISTPVHPRGEAVWVHNFHNPFERKHIAEI